MSDKPKVPLVPQLRFPDFLEADGWVEKKLSDILNPTVREVVKPSSRYLAVGIRSHGKGTFHKPDQEPEKNSMDRLYLVHRDDLIVSITFAWEGAIAIATEADHGAFVSHRFPTYVFKPAESAPAFLRHVISKEAFTYKLGLISPGGAGRNRVMNKKGFLETSVVIPSLLEQQKIADCLSSLDELIAAQARKVDALKTHKKGLMQQLFPLEGETHPRLRFLDFKDAGDWEKDSLKSLCMRIMDGTHFSPKSKKGPRPYLTSKNIREGRLDLSNLSYISEDDHAEIYSKCPVMTGDVLLTKDGANTGNCAINNLEFEFSLLSSVAVLRSNSSKLHQNFLYQSIISDAIQSLISESMAGQAITRITLAKIGSFNIFVTSLQEQQRIADCLATFDAYVTAAARELETLKTHKKGLVQQLFPSAEAVDA